MTTQEVSLLVGAVIGLLSAGQTWLAVRSVQHGRQLDGLMTPRITAGADQAIAADHVARSETATPQNGNEKPLHA